VITKKGTNVDDLVQTIVNELGKTISRNIMICDYNKKCTQIAGNFYHHADAAVRCRAHRLIEHIPGFTRQKPLEAAIGRVLKSHRRGSHHGHNFGGKHKTLTNQSF